MDMPDTWVGLNDRLMTADEATCVALLELERAGKARRQFMLRIHSRLNKVRADHERRELVAVAKVRTRAS